MLINRLPAHSREMCALRLFRNGKDTCEIAGHFGISEAAAYRLLIVARRAEQAPPDN